jgi:hypothetical protein
MLVEKVVPIFERNTNSSQQQLEKFLLRLARVCSIKLGDVCISSPLQQP